MITIWAIEFTNKTVNGIAPKRKPGFLIPDIISALPWTDTEFVACQFQGEALLHPRASELIEGLSRRNVHAFIDTFHDAPNLKALLPTLAKVHSVMLNLGAGVNLADGLALRTELITASVQVYARLWTGFVDSIPLFLPPKVFKEERDLTQIGVPPQKNPYDFLGPPSRAYCYPAEDGIAIQWDGDVVPCPYFDSKEVVFGNVLKQDVLAIWDSPERTAFLKATNIPQVCQGCAGCLLPGIVHPPKRSTDGTHPWVHQM